MRMSSLSTGFVTLLVAVAATGAHAQTAVDTGHKSPVLAGVASY